MAIAHISRDKFGCVIAAICRTPFSTRRSYPSDAAIQMSPISDAPTYHMPLVARQLFGNFSYFKQPGAELSSNFLGKLKQLVGSPRCPWRSKAHKSQTRRRYLLDAPTSRTPLLVRCPNFSDTPISQTPLYVRRPYLYDTPICQMPLLVRRPYISHAPICLTPLFVRRPYLSEGPICKKILYVRWPYL